MATSRETAAAHAPEVGVSPGRIATPRLVYVVIAVAAVAGALLRLYQLSRPGYLLGVTEYDDGVQFGDAVRLVSGVIPYRDFVVVQPPGSVLLMTPVALLAKVTGTAWGLGIARLLTAAADTVCIVLLGLLSGTAARWRRGSRAGCTRCTPTLWWPRTRFCWSHG